MLQKILYLWEENTSTIELYAAYGAQRFRFSVLRSIHALILPSSARLRLALWIVSWPNAIDQQPINQRPAKFADNLGSADIIELT
jgi:hypothetical protein